MNVNYGGSVISWCDSKNASLMVWFGGCPYHCFYCQNRIIRDSKNYINVNKVKLEIEKNASLVSEVIFSGGEPFAQMEALIELSKYAKGRSLKVGIETSGYNSENSLPLFKENLVDAIYLDFKTSPQRYPTITGYDESFRDVYRLMLLCKMYNVSCELRVTNVPEVINNDIIKEIQYIAEQYKFGFRLQPYKTYKGDIK
jgi:pyruvate formate lyase activating enzyme